MEACEYSWKINLLVDYDDEDNLDETYAMWILKEFMSEEAMDAYIENSPPPAYVGEMEKKDAVYETFFDPEKAMKYMEEFPRQTYLQKLCSSEEYQNWLGDHLGNQLWLDDAHRAARLADYAENGEEGSTHGETLDDVETFLESYETEWKEEILQDICFVRETLEEGGLTNQIIG